MLSLRDSGKIQEATTSILQVASGCGMKAPFSLADFITMDCPVDVRHFRICVVLFIWTPLGAQTQKPKQDWPWYQSYFLDWHYSPGVARYWYKESFGKVKIDGTTTQWLTSSADPHDLFQIDGNSSPTKEVDRAKGAKIAVELAKSQGISPKDYDGFVSVIALPDDYSVDGGTTSSSTHGQTISCSVFKADDGGFDFHSHEVGHLIGRKVGFDHSFGIETNSYCSGVYGHPFCIMSAMTYGDVSSTFTPVASAPAEEATRGPGLNGGTRYVRGWANGFRADLATEPDGQFEIQRLGASRPGFQVLIIANGNRTYAVEYRSSRDENDQGIRGLFGSPADGFVVVSALNGGNAWNINGPGCATYLGQIDLLADKAGAIVNFDPYWGVQLVSASGFSVQVKIVRRFLFSVRTYSRTHNVTLCTGLRTWVIGGQPLKNLRSLI